MAQRQAPGFIKYPDYDLRIERSTSMHQIIFNEAVVAASDQVLIVREGKYAPVLYFPANSVEKKWLRRSEHGSHCPFKGDASYYSIRANGQRASNAAWVYNHPFDEVASLEGYIAFYLEQMTCYWRDGIEQPLDGTAWRNAA